MQTKESNLEESKEKSTESTLDSEFEPQERNPQSISPENMQRWHSDTSFQSKDVNYGWKLPENNNLSLVQKIRNSFQKHREYLKRV